jgi:type II secretion system protein N
MQLPRVALPKLTGWKRRAAYGAFLAASFLFALQRTFPAEAVRERIMLEAAAQGWQVRMGEVSPSGFAGMTASAVTLESRDGLRIPIEEARASLRLWPLLLGRRGIAFDLVLFQGRLRGVVEEGRGWQRLALTGKDVDLSRAAPVKKASGIDLAGVVSAQVDVTLFAREPARSTGRLEVTVEKAAVNGGEVPVPGMGGNLSLPRFALGKVTARASVRDGKAIFDELVARSDDVEVSGEQIYVQLQPNLEHAPLYGRARVKLADGFWQKSGTAGLRGVAEMALASARGRDGAYGFQLYGTLGHPQARPAGQ